MRKSEAISLLDAINSFITQTHEIIEESRNHMTEDDWNAFGLAVASMWTELDCRLLPPVFDLFPELDEHKLARGPRSVREWGPLRVKKKQE